MKTVQKTAFAAFLVLLSLLLCSGCGSKEGGDTDERVAEAYNAGVAHFQDQRSFSGYWEVFGAYACLDEEIYGRAYDFSAENEGQRGAKLLALMMLGENPYDVDGVDLVEDILNQGADGAFAIPVLNFLALQAAGADIGDDLTAAYIDYCCTQMTELTMGPDIGGWAAVALKRYMDDPVYQDQITAAADTYVAVVGEDLTSGSMGSGGITAGCVVTALTALTAAGREGCDPTVDEPWTKTDPLSIMYDNLFNGEENVSDYYKNQYYLQFADLYNVLYEKKDMAWSRCGVTEEKLAALIKEAEALDDDAAVAAALEPIQALSEEERTAAAPGWGKLYYDLYTAVAAVK